MAETSAPVVPNFGLLLAPLLLDLEGPRRPAFLARLERTAAARYRAWADDLPEWSQELLGCADREDEIADRMINAFPVTADAAAELDARLPKAREIYYRAFDGMDPLAQLAVQAGAERQGAQAWRSVANTPGLSDEILVQLAACSALEEATADVVDALLIQ